MKKLFLAFMIAIAATGLNAQTLKGEGSLLGNVGYQTNMKDLVWEYKDVM